VQNTLFSVKQMTRYIIMHTGKQGRRFWNHKAYHSQASAEKEVNRAVDIVVRRAMRDAARMTSAIRGVNAPRFQQLLEDTMAYRETFEIVSLGEVF